MDIFALTFEFTAALFVVLYIAKLLFSDIAAFSRRGDVLDYPWGLQTEKRSLLNQQVFPKV